MASERGCRASLAEVPPQTEEQRAEILASRSRQRAFDGAPPTIPHAVHGQSTFECLACHEKGAIIAGKRAPAMSHERHDSCTQCHVSAGGPPSAPPPPLTSSTFVGQAPVVRRCARLARCAADHPARDRDARELRQLSRRRRRARHAVDPSLAGELHPVSRAVFDP